MNIEMEYHVSLTPTLILPTKVCFVCTGNTCRSPMAAAVLNKLGGRFGITAVSAGLFPNVGSQMTENAEKALKNFLFPVPIHYSRNIDEKIVRECDRIVGITENHEFLLIQTFPFAVDKICAMPEDINDPWGGNLESYEECLLQIIKGVKELFKLYD